MIQITITGDTKDELAADYKKLGAILFGVTGAKSALSAAEEARLRGDATVVGAQDKKAADKKKAAEKDKASEKEDDDGLGEDDNDDGLGGEVEAVTRDDVHKLLVEVKDLYKAEPTTISDIVKKFGVKKFTDIKDDKLAEVAKVAKEYIAKAPKKSKAAK